MAFHELATNAAKYGALASSDGRNEVKWQTSDARLQLKWRELNCCKADARTSRGFGSTVLERIAPAAVSGTGGIDFDEGGLTWTLDAPMEAVEARLSAPNRRACSYRPHGHPMTPIGQVRFGSETWVPPDGARVSAMGGPPPAAPWLIPASSAGSDIPAWRRNDTVAPKPTFGGRSFQALKTKSRKVAAISSCR